jgi:hypothetical protein
MANNLIFVDSGAHSIYTREIIKKGFKASNYGYYETDEYWKYVDSYAAFLKENLHLIETYVNVDVIFNNELTWKTQKYMEDAHGLSPLPVFHAGDGFDYWLNKYLDNYEYIGIGGLGQQSSKSQWKSNMGDPVFSKICKAPDYMPTHKIHGFAVTSPVLLAEYPWFSVDSTSWFYLARYGIIIFPRKICGKYDYRKSPYTTVVSSRPAKKGTTSHFDNYVDMHQDYFREYFEAKGFSIGVSEFKTVDSSYKLEDNEVWAVRKDNLVEVVIEHGLCNTHELRDRLNLQFYLDLEASLPPWPHPWTKKYRNTRLF